MKIKVIIFITRMILELKMSSVLHKQGSSICFLGKYPEVGSYDICTVDPSTAGLVLHGSTYTQIFKNKIYS